MQLGDQPGEIGDQHDREGAGQKEHDPWNGVARATPGRERAHQPEAEQGTYRVGAGRDDRGERQVGGTGRRQHQVHPDQDRTRHGEQPGIEQGRALPARSVAAQHVAEADSEEGVAGELDDVASYEADDQEDEAGHEGAAGRQLGAGLGVGDARHWDG